MLVRWTKPAANDLKHICDYTEKHFGPAQARRAATAIYDSADSLQALPNRGRKGREANTREISVSGLLTLEVVEDDQPRRRVTRIAGENLPWRHLGLPD